MLSRRSAGVLFLSVLMLSSLAAAVESDVYTSADKGLAATNFALTFSGSLPGVLQSRVMDGMSDSNLFSHPRAWILPIPAHGMEGYVLTAVITETGRSGFTGVSLQSTTATREGYFGGPIVLASNPEPTSFVAEPSTANLTFTGIFFAVGMVRRRILAP